MLSHARFFSTAANKHFLLFYTYVPNMLERRTPIRPSHLSYAKQHKQNGLFLMGGAYDDVSGATIVLKANTRAEAEEFAKKDPYVVSGLVTKYEIREWNVVPIE